MQEPYTTRLGAVPNYGVDAPGVVKTFLAVGVALGGAAFALAVSAETVAAQMLGWATVGVAVIPLLLACSMLFYSFAGKHRLRDHLLRQREWRGDETVLDIGAGRGLMALAAASRVPHGTVIALDIWNAKDLSDNGAEALRANAHLERVEQRLHIVTGDARQLDLPDASIDVVLSVFCIHNITPAEERLTACREIARVLKPGGMAMIADFPGVRPYVETLRNVGLRVEGPARGERLTLGIAGYLVAFK